MTKTAEKPCPLGPHIPIKPDKAYIREYPPPRGSCIRILLPKNGTSEYPEWKYPWKLYKSLEDVTASGRNVWMLLLTSCLPFSMSIALISSAMWRLQCLIQFYPILFRKQAKLTSCCMYTWVFISLYNKRNNASIVFFQAIFTSYML